jgi:hypothetical protein
LRTLRQGLQVGDTVGVEDNAQAIATTITKRYEFQFTVSLNGTSDAHIVTTIVANDARVNP